MRFTVRIGAIICAAILLASVGVRAQDATPSSPGDTSAQSFIAAVYLGSCNAPDGEIVAELGTAEAPQSDATPVASEASEGARPVVIASESAAVQIAELTLQPHAIVIRAGTEADAPVVACGDVLGPVTDGQLVIGIYPVTEGGPVGIAILDESAEPSLSVSQTTGESENVPTEEAAPAQETSDEEEVQTQITVYLLTDAHPLGASPAA